jgi:hypothetical protein
MKADYIDYPLRWSAHVPGSGNLCADKWSVRDANGAIVATCDDRWIAEAIAHYAAIIVRRQGLDRGIK